MAISITSIELLALKKLAVVGNALADRLDNLSAKREQRALVKVLVDVIGRAELDNLAPAAPGARQ